MTTAASPAADVKPLLDPLPEQDGWSTQHAPELYKFENRGDDLHGQLVAVDRVEIKDAKSGAKKMVTQFVARIASGQLVKFLGSYDLMQKLSEAHVGKLIRVKYLGDDPSISRNGNAMKIFSVQTKDAPKVTNAHGLEVTDQDIPF
jgi:hypothetical protein